MTADEIIGLLKTYVNKTLVGGGALKGKNCTIDSIAPITGGNRVTFKWTLDDGTVETGHLDVINGLNGQDGEDGKDGKGIQSVSVNENNHLIITYSDGTTTDAGQIEIHSAVDSVNGQTGAVTLDADDVGALPADTPIPSKTSALTNDSGFITKVVNDLVNYYLKSETYSKTQVDDIVTAVKNSRFEVVATLPTTDIKTNVIYLVPKNPTQTSNVKDEYINLDGTTAGWEKIGDTEIDLSDYVTTQALNTALANYTTTDDLTTLLAAKQDTLTFDDAPTENSNNPVKSGGVFTSEQDIYEVMGQNGAKNLIAFDPYTDNISGTWSGNSYTASGVTFTVNDDGSILVNGTATASPVIFTLSSADQAKVLKSGKRYILSGPPANMNCALKFGTLADVSNGGSATFIYDGVIKKVQIAIRNNATINNLTYYPMIRLVTDTDPTYAPPAKTNLQLTQDSNAFTNYVNNNGAKNLLPTPYTNTKGDTYTGYGLTFTENADGSITCSGTNTSGGMTGVNIQLNHDASDFVGKTITASIENAPANENSYCPLIFRDSGGTNIARYDIDSASPSFTFTVPSNAVTYDFQIYVRAGKGINATLYPMIRLASDTDSTYQPYAKTNLQLTQDSVTWDNLSEVGAVNPINFTAITPTSPISGVTFTVNSDKSITCSDATATGNIRFVVGTATLKAGKSYRINDLKNGTANAAEDGVFGVAVRLPGSTWLMNTSSTPGSQPTIYSPTTDTKVEIIVYINSGYNANRTFYPMLTCATYTGPYVPPAMTNKELTDFVSDMETLTDATQITVTDSSVLEINSVNLTRKGNVLCGLIMIKCKTDLPYNTTLFTLPTGFRPSAFCNIVGVENTANDSGVNMFGLWSSGDVQLQCGIASASKYYRLQIIGII